MLEPGLRPSTPALAPAPHFSEDVSTYCTYFDQNYLSRGLTLLESLRKHAGPFCLYVLCLDDATHQILSGKAYRDVILVRLSELEQFDPELFATRPTRSLVEYYFTLTPCWLRYVMQRYPGVQLLTYLDADLCFYSSPAPLFEELGQGSIATVEHRFLPEYQHLAANGRFNVGWLSFRRDSAGNACLAWWRERCIEWCYDRVEADRFADQKYLDRWPELFAGVVILRHPGVNIAPWNVARFAPQLQDGRVYYGGQPLICYHYHQLKHVLGPYYSTGLASWRVPLSQVLSQALYTPYVASLLRHEREIQRSHRAFGTPRSVRDRGQGLLQRTRRAALRPYRVAKLLLSRSLVRVDAHGVNVA